MTDELLQLMTACIDGVLNPAEAGVLSQSLAASAEARATFAHLKANSVRLRKSRRVAPPAGLHKRVMACVATLTPAPMHAPHLQKCEKKAEPTRNAPVPASPTARKSRAWAPIAIAAGLLISVTAGSFLFFNQQNDRNSTARNPNRPPPATRAGADNPEWAKWLPVEHGPRPSVPVPRERPDNTVVVRPAVPAVTVPSIPVEPDASLAVAPQPRPVRSDLHAAQPQPETVFDLVQVRLPFLRPLSDLDRDDTRRQLAEELARDPAFRIDLFTRDPARAVAVFRDAAKVAGLTVFTDATTQDRLTKRQVNTIAIYTESFTAAELAELLGKLNAEDAKISPRVFDALHAMPVSNADNTDIKAILGIDPGLFKRPIADKEKDKADKTPDPTKPISAGTVTEVIKSVTAGQPGANAQPKPAEKTAMLLTWGPNANRTTPNTSTELKQFLSKRGDRKSNAVPAIIVIRPGNG